MTIVGSKTPCEIVDRCGAGAMIKITEIDPDKKYILSIVEPMTDDQVVRLRERFIEAMQQDGTNLIVIAGSEITLIPTDQVVGFVSIGEKDGTE